MRQMRQFMRLARMARGPMTRRRLVRIGAGLVVAILLVAVRQAMRH